MTTWQRMTPDRREHVKRLHARAPVLDAHCDSFRAIMIGMRIFRSVWQE